MIIHGGFMEIGGCLALLPVLIFGNPGVNIGVYFTFIVPFFQENIDLLICLGLIYGVIRVIGAIGLLKNKQWGFVLSVINCIVTLILMPFMLPAGIWDGLFAGSALILMLVQYFGNKKITE